MANDLKPYENITCVFWIRVELKENQRAGRQAFGEIKDVKSGEKQPIYSLLDINPFIARRMREMGMRIGWLWRFTIWMKSKISLGKQ